MLASILGSKNGKSNEPDENNQLAIEAHIEADRGVTIRTSDARGGQVVKKFTGFDPLGLQSSRMSRTDYESLVSEGR
jgi:hypothetical protein